MVIEKNSRQVPKAAEFLSNKKYCDILYCYFQTISSWDEVEGHPRYFAKKEKNFSKIAETLGLSRQTVSSRFASLEQLGLIKEDKINGRYELLILAEDIASLIPAETVRILVNTMNENTISVYVYLLNRYYAATCNGKQEFMFTKEQLKTVIGLSSATRSNDYIIDDKLNVLKKLGLLEYEARDDKDKITGDIKTHLYVTKMMNKIENC